MIDLEAYFRRIDYRGALAVDLATLAALQEHHVAAIAFEAIDVLLDRGVDISPKAVETKLVGRRRGGYCYEQNGLFRQVLEALGFEVEPLLARVNWMMPAGSPLRPPTHMALRVNIEGKAWLADTGFGSCVPTAPLRLDSRNPQPTRHETFRLMPVDDELQLEVAIAGGWAPLYRLLGARQRDVDFEPANWYTATHPASHFRHRLIVTRTTSEARHILAGARLTVRHPDGISERRILGANEIERELAERFLLPVEAEWRPVIENVAMDVAPTS